MKNEKQLEMLQNTYYILQQSTSSANAKDGINIKMDMTANQMYSEMIRLIKPRFIIKIDVAFCISVGNTFHNSCPYTLMLFSELQCEKMEFQNN